MRTNDVPMAEFADVKPDAYDDINFRATAAKGKDGSLAVFVSRYHAREDGGCLGPKKVKLVVPGYAPEKAVCHLTDIPHTYTEVPLEVNEDGSLTFELQPHAFALVEFP